MATGLVGAVSCLVLGNVFVANVTGNVVFLGFALAGPPGFPVSASLAAEVPDTGRPIPRSRPHRRYEATVDGTHLDHQTRYELHDDTGLTCVLTYPAASDEPAVRKILLPAPGGA
jgi:hypothetical protein